MRKRTLEAMLVLGIGLLMSTPTQGGVVVGKAILEGTFEIAGKQTMDADQLILGRRSVVVSDQKGLANVVVSVEAVPGTYSAPVHPAELNQKEKTFVPHVLPIVKGQRVEFVNSDQILHNIHGYNGEGTLFNVAMPFQGQRMAFDVEAEDGVAMITCDVHKHMRAWVLLRENPYFAVSRESGLFSIEDVPAGTYTLRAWHEVFGTLEQTVTVQGGSEKTPVIFKFQAP